MDNFYKSKSLKFFLILCLFFGCINSQQDMPVQLVEGFSGDLSCEKLYLSISTDWENSNHCEKPADCDAIQLGGKYVDFGCFKYVNKNSDVEKIYGKIQKYMDKCSSEINDCGIKQYSLDCVENKCTKKNCKSNSHCQNLDCSIYDRIEKSPHAPECIQENCLCMCRGCK